MNHSEIENKVMEIYKKIIFEATGEKIEVKASDTLSREKGFDSLGIVEFIIGVEETFEINLNLQLAEIRNANTIEDLVRIITLVLENR